MRTRHDYDESFKVLRTAIARWDPYGLLGGGAPADEWDGEIAKLLPKIQRARASADIANELANAFGQSLGGHSLSVEECRAVAEDIFQHLSAAGLLRV